MKHKTTFVFVSTLIMSAALHAAGFGLTYNPPRAEIAGGATAQFASLGNSFEDHVAGAQRPVEPMTEDVTDTAEPEATIAPPSPSTQAQTADPNVQATAPIQSPVVVSPQVHQTPQTDVSSRVTATPNVQIQMPTERTRRPTTRPDPQVQQQAAQRPRGSNNIDTRRGQSDGRREATAADASETPTQTQNERAGNAAASNYDGIVWNRLRRTRVRTPNVSGEGVVQFRIAANGALDFVRIQRSSGNDRLDQSGIDHVRRAAPFAPPPTGARRTFGYVFEGQR
ncbi:cell envelope integrity protein TolA [Cochlodiniinecator piscidefendens]|uniref:cell envelope integrity protein TolA n=1 Tax=Cochlodiniinecator piscidefendens TaxID=2715756 RepID=UPI00140C97BA|nr:cell envelope integrity protein TolA [Cochlodiniinecator piscidefendens]